MSDGPSGNYAEDDLATVLLIVATAMLIGGTIYIAMRSQALFGSWNPFSGA